MSATSSVLDASALLTFLFREAGADLFVDRAGPRPAMSAVNWSEVTQKSATRGIDRRRLLGSVTAAGLTVVDLTVDRAERVADLWAATRPHGLSLADRACLALALELRVPAVTADRTWTRLRVDHLAVHSLR